ncbi:sugar-transfer associated ATP-grasp domain-containing protein [Ilyobacter sp.]|uniref:sugar-transfer associated ATP-grasp domain-containing protein n=1 Tax=Ilyobacter sp. TaxID=3100343 RepID=UPI0035648D1C
MLNIEKKIDHFSCTLKKKSIVFRSNCKIIALTAGKGFFLEKIQKSKIKDYWKKYGIHIKNYQWHKICCNLNTFDERYLTYPVFVNQVLPYLNNLDFLRSYNDKNMLNRLFPDMKQPKILYRDINGKSYDGEYREIHTDLFIKEFLNHDGEYLIKPSINSGNARGIKLLSVKEKKIILDKKEMSFQDLIKEYKKDFLLQERLSQTEIFKKISPNSLSTIGVTTLRWENQFHILNTYMKFGTGESIIDNMATGGLEIGIDTETGKLKKYALLKNLVFLESHPDSKITFEGIEVPRFDEIISKAVECHKKLLYFDFVVWDFALDKNNEIYLIEPNLGAQSVNSLQVNNGPLFGGLSDEIFEKIFKSKI